METLTAGQLSTTIYVLLAIFGGIITVDKVLDIVKKWRAPSSDVYTKLSNDKQRLDEHEQQLQALKAEQLAQKENSRVQCAALLALLDHELHNGNADQMQAARDDLVKWLTNK